jgi:hypothetical protein
MTKIFKMQIIPNLFLLVGRDDQLAYFTMLTPISTINCHMSLKIFTNPTTHLMISSLKKLKENN